jgi:glutamate N-acetyltransferase/amino-acid N-acetyltransferase
MFLKKISFNNSILSFIFTDVKATQSELQDCLTTATNQSFNRVMFERPTAAKIRPQLASAANKAVLTNGECATV